MYPVSAAYKAALRDKAKTRRIRGTVGTLPFTDANIIEGTLKIDNCNSEGTQLTLGSVYIGEMTAVFRGIDLTGEWMGKTITIYEDLMISPDTWESVPLGIFHVVEAQHQETGVYVVAYDVMEYMDKPWPYTEMSGYPWDYIEIISQLCGVTFKQTEEQIQQFPNGHMGFVLYPENDISTCRDLLYWLAQAMGCFATATRDGKVEFRMYGGEPIDEVGASIRWEGSSFSDYITKYTAVQLTKIEDSSVVYKAAEVDDGLTYDLGGNPLLQYIDLDMVLDNLVWALSEAVFTPFNVDRAGCPAYDLGDVLVFPDGIGGNRIGCIMAYEYDYHDVYMIDCYGANPSLMGVQTKEDKALSGAINRANANEIQYYTFTNGKEINLDNRYTDIIDLRFGSIKGALVVFQAEIKLDLLTVDEARAVVEYIYNSLAIEYHPEETWGENGAHLLHLLYYYRVSGGELNTLKVRMKILNGTATIDRANVQACVWGQGLAATDKWDGWIELEDQIAELDFSTAPGQIDDFIEDLQVTIPELVVIDLTEHIGEPILATTPPDVIKIDERLYINKEMLHRLNWSGVKSLGTWGTVKESYGW